MSSASSIASSLSSLASSASSRTKTTPAPPVDAEIQHSDADDGYSEVSFETDESVERQGDIPRQNEKDTYDGDGDGYSDEEFEEEAGDQDGKQEDGGDDLDSDDFSEHSPHDEAAAEVPAPHEFGMSSMPSTPLACDRGMQQPEGDLSLLVEEWARHKTRLVWSRLQSGRCKRHSAMKDIREHQKPIPRDAVSAISEKLQQRRASVKGESTRQQVRRSESRCVPSSLMDRVSVQHLLALSATPPPPPPACAERRHGREDSLSTFCSVKVADLSGRLATVRLDGLLAKWHVPTDDNDTLSRGVMEFITSTARHQRHEAVLRASKGDDCVFRSMRSHTVNLERTVQVATDAVADSRRLLGDAQRILSAPDAHHCRCEL